VSAAPGGPGGPAAAGAVAAVLHVPLAVAHAGASLPLALVLLLMSLVCLPCAGHLWRAPSRRAWTVAAVAGSGMLLAHAVLLLLPAAGSGAFRVTGHTGHSTAVGLPFLHSTGWLLVVSALTLAQVVTALAVLRAGVTDPAVRRRNDHFSRV
jgi:hypothetical protein